MEEFIWHSGDWRNNANTEAPYNGIEIRIKANYAALSPFNLSTVDVKIIDYTYTPDGVESDIILTKRDEWYTIPIPEIKDETVSKANPEFTVKGIFNLEDNGLLKLENTTTGIYLNIQFRYGILNGEELGFIARIEEVKQPIEKTSAKIKTA